MCVIYQTSEQSSTKAHPADSTKHTRLWPRATCIQTQSASCHRLQPQLIMGGGPSCNLHVEERSSAWKLLTMTIIQSRGLYVLYVLYSTIIPCHSSIIAAPATLFIAEKNSISQTIALFVNN